MAFTWSETIAKGTAIKSTQLSEIRSKIDNLYDTLCRTHNNTIYAGYNGTIYNTHNRTIQSSYNSGYDSGHNGTIWTGHNSTINSDKSVCSNNSVKAPNYNNKTSDYNNKTTNKVTYYSRDYYNLTTN